MIFLYLEDDKCVAQVSKLIELIFERACQFCKRGRGKIGIQIIE